MRFVHKPKKATDLKLKSDLTGIRGVIGDIQQHDEKIRVGNALRTA